MIFYVSFSLNTSFKAYGLRHTSGRIRHLWKRDLFWTWLDPQVATPPYFSFLPPSAHWCCMSVWHVWENVTRSRAEERLSEKQNHCTPLVFTRIEFPFSKATWGFSCVFAPIALSSNVSFSLFTIVPWSFVPRGCYWQLWSTKREERWLVATVSYLNFELLSAWIAFFECFVFSGRMHSIKL